MQLIDIFHTGDERAGPARASFKWEEWQLAAVVGEGRGINALSKLKLYRADLFLTPSPNGTVKSSQAKPGGVKEREQSLEYHMDEVTG